LSAFCCDSDSVSQLLKVWHAGTKSLLHVDDEERRLREFENIWVLHVIDFEKDLIIGVELEQMNAGIQPQMNSDERRSEKTGR
jgi:hypothetical protein